MTSLSAITRVFPLQRSSVVLLLAVALSTLSIAEEIKFRSTGSGFEMAVVGGLEWHFLDSTSSGETNYNQAAAEQRCAKADASAPLRLPTEAEMRALASAGSQPYSYQFWTSTPGVARSTMKGFADKRYTFADAPNMKLRLMCVRQANLAAAVGKSTLMPTPVAAKELQQPAKVAVVPPVSPMAISLEQQHLIDQLDQLDQLELKTEIDRAEACIARRDFSCGEKSLAKAARYAKGARDKAALAQTQASMNAEIERVREEESERVARLERQQREQERAERRRRVEEAEERRAERQANRDAEHAALVNMIGAMGRTQKPNDWLLAETQRTLAQTPQLIAQAQREREREAAARQASANQAARERLVARQEAQAAAEQRASADAARSLENAQRARREQEEARAREQREAERAREEAADRAQRERERAELAAKKRQEAQDEAKAASDYLAALTRSTRLLARKCPDGEGRYYIVGKRPNIKPEAVGCVDVHYRAQCVNSTSFTDGVGANFVGMGTDCFTGDTYPIEPKPACKVEEVQVTVRSFAACRK